MATPQPQAYQPPPWLVDLAETAATRGSEASDAAFATIVAIFSARTYLAIEPLITINAIGVGMMLFALEQRIEKMDQRTKSKFEWKRVVNLLAAMDSMVAAGFFNLASMILVLTGRFSCDEGCAAAEGDVVLAWATNLTIFGALIVVIAFARAYTVLMTLSSPPPGPAEETPTLLSP